MFCPDCGAQVEEGPLYCPSCGSKILNSHTPHISLEEVVYSEEWMQAKIFAVATIPHLDILIDKENLFLIKLPTSHAPTWGFLIGLIGSLIGAVIGYVIGAEMAKRKRQRARAAWVDQNHKLISNQYQNYIFLKFPLETLRSHLAFKKGKRLEFTYADGKVTLKNKKDYVIVTNLLKSYVL